MKIDYGLILSAGMGTRMGEIGKVLPKPLWPVFEKRIIDLQISYMKKLGIDKIFINIHFHMEKIKNYIKTHYGNDIVLLEEPILLDVGGAVLNLKHHLGGNGKVLAISGDQFMFFNYENFFSSYDGKSTAFLLTTEFKKKQGYNGLDLDGNYLKKIVANKDLDDQQTHYTYSGMSIIDLHQVKGAIAPTNLFSALGIGNASIQIHKEGNYQYFDFGTVDRYSQSLFSILQLFSHKKNNFAFDFFSTNKILDESKIRLYSGSELSYGNTENPMTINFSGQKIENLSGNIVIVLEGTKRNYNEKGIYYNNYFSSGTNL